MKRFLLFIVLAGLAYYMTSNAGHFKKATKLQTNLLKVDTAQLTRILIYPKDAVKTELTFNREENGWIATHLTKNIRINPTIMQQMLTNLMSIKPNRVVANQSKDWATYGVDALQSSKVTAFIGENEAMDFIIGKSKMSKNNSRKISYIRINNGEEVFEIDGHYPLFEQKFADYRDKTVLTFAPNKVQQFSLENGEMPLDSLTQIIYLKNIANLQSSNFADDFDEIDAVDNLLKTLSIKLQNNPNPVKVSLYFDSTAVQPFTIHSSLNKDAYFASDSVGLYRQIFHPLLTAEKDIE